MTRKKRHGRQCRQRVALAVATAAVIAGLALLVHAVRSSPPEQRVVTTNATLEGASMNSDRRTLAAARAEARERKQETKYVLPPDPPPVGLPASTTKLPTQPDQPMPTPRGSYE
jgi:hypothetical protein